MHSFQLNWWCKIGNASFSLHDVLEKLLYDFMALSLYSNVFPTISLLNGLKSLVDKQFDILKTKKEKELYTSLLIILVVACCN